jgi:HlyD family secretion protein
LLNLRKSTVARVDLSSVMTSSGRVESLHNTIISCELERLEIRVPGQSMSSGGASIIIQLIPEGTQVKKGDVLCRLDSSEYEELVRTQEIKTEQADAALKQARLNFEVAELAVKEYRDGLFNQYIQTMQGSIALSKSDFERSTDRLQWTEKMLQKGYASLATKQNAIQSVNQSLLDLQVSRDDLSNFREYGSPKTLKVLESEVEMRRYETIANTQRVTRNRERLDYYKLMVDLCTIKAPHDGFLIYAVDPSRMGADPIEEGQTVRQSQKLFFLPDLANMQVLTYLHESVSAQVHPGMRARARIEGLANRVLEGHVVAIQPLPTIPASWIKDDVKYFMAEVKLDSVPEGIRPGMSAEVEFDVERRLDVLAVPSEAVAVENGHNICYVAGVDGLERRPVTLGRSTRDLLEVTKGLAEGDKVVLQPDKIEALDSLLVNSSKDTVEPEVSATDAFAPPSSPVSVE